MQKIFEGLNQSQQEAVKTTEGAVLILAGAGSGKTKTIISRLAYLLEVVGITPRSILTLTFTNKAATEMRERAMNLIDNSTLLYPPLLCTFHKFGLIFLKKYIHTINRQNNFLIIDTDDKKTILKKIIKDFGFDFDFYFVASEISKYKNILLKPDDAVSQAILPDYKKITKIYQKYNEHLIEKNLLDFDDLLVLTYQILNSNDEILNMVSGQYQYVMVDEYQDTNQIQSLIIKKLTSIHQNLCVVGDDDQSIYGWRGASVHNILNFAEENKGCKTIKLELNYRSSKNILDCANQLIEHNRTRLGKKLIATHPAGKEVEIISSFHEKIESQTIASKVSTLITHGIAPQNIAIIYRLNALSRSLEEGLNIARVPYKIVSGAKFYERAEIKDVISYFRAISNLDDDFSINRIINRPRRGVGKMSLNQLLTQSQKKSLSLFRYVKNHRGELQKLINKKSYSSITYFFDSLEKIKQKTENSIINLVDELENHFQIKDFFAEMTDSIDRVANIDEFYGLFREDIEKNPQLTLDEFLNGLALESDQDLINNQTVSVMSIHASKGLEFEYLFVVGLENKFFPLVGDGCNIEEERRLAYVAFTRAKKELFLSHCDSRFHKGQRTQLTKSPFLQECGVYRGAIHIKDKKCFNIGDIVNNKIFGMGRVVKIKKEGRSFKLTINFGGIRKDIVDSFVEKI